MCLDALEGVGVGSEETRRGDTDSSHRHCGRLQLKPTFRVSSLELNCIK